VTPKRGALRDMLVQHRSEADAAAARHGFQPASWWPLGPGEQLRRQYGQMATIDALARWDSKADAATGQRGQLLAA